MRSSSQFIIDRFAARAGTTERTFATASAPFIQVADTHWELFFMMQNDLTELQVQNKRKWAPHTIYLCELHCL